MKKTHIIFLTSIITHMLTGMEGEPLQFPQLTSVYKKSNTQYITDVSVQDVSKKINQKYASHFILDMFSLSNLTELSMIDIFDIVKKQHEDSKIEINEKFLKSLYNKNDFFKKSVDHFTSLSQNSLRSITPAYLNTIQNPLARHPLSLLNKLPLEIKKYVMNKAQNNIIPQYDIPIKSKNDVIIYCRDICPATYTLAIGIDNAILMQNIADLKAKKKYLRITLQPRELSFNNDGSLIASTEYDDTTEHYHIKIYSVITKKLLYTVLSTTRYARAHFLRQTPENILLVVKQHKNGCDTAEQILYSVENDAEPHIIGILPIVDIRFAATIKKENYRITPIEPDGHFIVIKKSLARFLCLQAAANINNIIVLDSIIKSEPYNELTPHEKITVLDAINERKTTLSAQKSSFTIPVKKRGVQQSRSPQSSQSQTQYYTQLPFIYQTTNGPCITTQNSHNQHDPLYYKPPTLIQPQQYIQSSHNNG